MKEPNCRNIVPINNLWQIAIDFIGRIDRKQIEYNIKLAYIVYNICKIEKISVKHTKSMVFLSCFNDVGKFSKRDDGGDVAIETYLFLKYFSPVKSFAEVVINNSSVIKRMSFNKFGKTFEICKKYTKYLNDFENDKDKALKKILFERNKYNMVDVISLQRLVNKTDMLYEINSGHYKTVVYKFVSRMIYGFRERNQFITMLSSLFEMYNKTTLAHSKATAIIAYRLSGLLKIKSIRRKKIYVASLCHDLGKVSIPLRILDKPDKLTDREFMIMKKHVNYTKEILDGNMDNDIVEIAYRHHERLDGSGYPKKLKGKDMTLDQEILQVADVISALIAKRSYKDAWDINMVIEILDKNVSEGKLNKDVIDAFKKHQEKVLKDANDVIEAANKKYDKIEKERYSLFRGERIW